MKGMIYKLTSLLQLPKESIEILQQHLNRFLEVLVKHDLKIDVGTWKLTPIKGEHACLFEGDTDTGNKQPVS